MTVAEVDALLYLPGHPREQVLRALRIPALSPGWQASFRALLEQAPRPGGQRRARAASPPPAGRVSGRCRDSRSIRESTTVISVHLADPDGCRAARSAAGQFLTLRLHPDPRREAAAAQLLAVGAARQPGTTGSASSASRTAPQAGICTPAFGSAICSRSRRRAARSCCGAGSARCC